MPLSYAFIFANGVLLEPQVQLTWMRLEFDEATDKVGTRVSFNDDDQTIGRLGARLDRTCQDDAQREYTPYLRAKYLHCWGGGSKVKVGSVDNAINQDFNARSARANTQLIPEVRPLPGQRTALFKNALRVFVRGAGRFAPQTIPSTS